MTRVRSWPRGNDRADGRLSGSSVGHAFWAVKDPMAAQMQMAMFMKNVSMGGDVEARLLDLS